MNATEEEQHVIAYAGITTDEHKKILDSKVPARIHGEVGLAHTGDVTYIDVSAKQPFSVATSLIPFLENDDANRALMGSNMMRQAVPIITPEAPFIGTGLEGKVARDSGVMIIAQEHGVVDSIDASTIVVKDEKGERHEYQLLKFVKSNQFTAINQHPIVELGQKIKKGDVIADGPATHQAEFALGRNLVVAFMSWEGANFEDAVILSERLVKEDLLLHHIEDYSIDVRNQAGRNSPPMIPNRSEAN